MSSTNEFAVGDIVVCINGTFDPSQEFFSEVKFFPEYMEIYTIRELDEHNAIRLREIKNPEFNFNGSTLEEPSFYNWRFVKLESNTTSEEEEVCEETLAEIL